jgi:hypothetical protein
VVVVRHQREAFESVAEQNNEGYEYRLFDLLWAINSQWYFAMISTSRFFALHPHTQPLPNTITASPQHLAPKFLSPTKLQPKPCFTSCPHLTYVHPQSTQSPPPNSSVSTNSHRSSRHPDPDASAFLQNFNGGHTYTLSWQTYCIGLTSAEVQPFGTGL